MCGHRLRTTVWRLSDGGSTANHLPFTPSMPHNNWFPFHSPPRNENPNFLGGPGLGFRLTHLAGLFGGPALFYLVELGLAADTVLDVRFLTEEKRKKHGWLHSQEREMSVPQSLVFIPVFG